MVAKKIFRGAYLSIREVVKQMRYEFIQNKQ